MDHLFIPSDEAVRADLTVQRKLNQKCLKELQSFLNGIAYCATTV